MADPKKILLAEDDEFLRDLYGGELKKAGYEILIASDGEEALQLIRREKPDLILLDIMMPKITGLDLLKKMKLEEELKAVPVILMTSLKQDSVINEGFTLGAVGYLVKTEATPSQVVNEVNKFFNSSQ